MPSTKLVDQVPQTIEEADREMRKLQRILREMDECRVARDTELHPILEQINPLQARADEINARAEARLAELQNEHDMSDARIRIYSQSHRRYLESLVKGKLFRFPCGGYVQWRLNPKKLKVSGKLETIVEALRQAGCSDLFEVIYKLKVPELKRHPKLIKNINGLEIVQDEVLIVNPNG